MNSSLNRRVKGGFSVALLQVFDYDFGLQDDFMGSAYLYLESLEQQRCVSPLINATDWFHLSVSSYSRAVTILQNQTHD